jgi:hypothetical protein
MSALTRRLIIFVLTAVLVFAVSFISAVATPRARPQLFGARHAEKNGTARGGTQCFAWYFTRYLA